MSWSVRPATRRLIGDRGDAALTAAILAPLFILLIFFAVFAGRLGVARGDVEQAARDAARAASLERNPGAADGAARARALSSVESSGAVCEGPPLVTVDTSQFDPPEPSAVGRVTVTVRCTIALRDISAPGIPGARTVSATATEVVDRFRTIG